MSGSWCVFFLMAAPLFWLVLRGNQAATRPPAWGMSIKNNFFRRSHIYIYIADQKKDNGLLFGFFFFWGGGGGGTNLCSCTSCTTSSLLSASASESSGLTCHYQAQCSINFNARVCMQILHYIASKLHLHCIYIAS